MKILLTNDDGIYAEGIQTLAKVLDKEEHEITLIAPDRERSASGHSITIKDPLRAQKVTFSYLEGVTCYKINGTPADCVKLGIEKFIDFKPDLILSGINDGANLGYDVLYSGTVSAAIEAWMMGYNSIAISLAVTNNRNFTAAARFINKFIKKLDITNLFNKTLLNINVPDLAEEKITDSFIADLGSSNYVDSFEERIDPMGQEYFWLSGKTTDDFARNTDIWAVNNDKISITPLKIDLTNVVQKEFLQNLID
jgi:5'-nucleotidase